ncbi:hypothetical protein [Mycoplasma sp. E35C]|uniref:hypothetical protein n=1 Tax=Mycoplasma sp. E35C TaxID=2801918 RepID=UPI001CA404F7|nr:hypothetical protein [Mycoplasma sp. E35C]QZX48827.1 hypothetical protein JJE79_02080 [Mycoplasma sp. E35C]
MFSNPNIEITIYVLIAIAMIAIFTALLWTKVIKKNTWIYCNKTLWTIKLIHKKIKDFLKTQSFNYYLINDVFFSSTKTKSNCFFYLNNVVITNKNVYLITYEVSKSATGITHKNQQTFLINKNQKQHDFAIEIQSVIDNYKCIKSVLNTDIKIIIPFENKNFQQDSFNNNPNIICVQTNRIHELILDLENQQQNVVNNDLEDLRKIIANNNYQRRIKLPFINLKTKNTKWEKQK